MTYNHNKAKQSRRQAKEAEPIIEDLILHGNAKIETSTKRHTSIISSSQTPKRITAKKMKAFKK